MMDQHRSEYFASPSEAFHPAFFSIADRLGWLQTAGIEKGPIFRRVSANGLGAGLFPIGQSAE